ncbi:hypothetical protein FACS18949_18310 [Clostridia bacterium]|nr:hypothetical protein FACS189425_04760 [Clostridia bacterium]GHV38068.1 hypothetical protein FACS18949_18310 [Clostridia bacterium]
MNRNKLREIAANEISRLHGETGDRPGEEWLGRDSQSELENAEATYHEWSKRFVDAKESNTAEDVVWTFVTTTEQVAMEAGIRLGMQLAMEIMGSSPTPSPSKVAG